MTERYGAAYNGVFVGTVAHRPKDAPAGLYVIVPRLNGSSAKGAMGPCVALSPHRLEPGTPVIVATVGGVKDDLIVLGVVHRVQTSSGNAGGADSGGGAGGDGSGGANQAPRGDTELWAPFAVKKPLLKTDGSLASFPARQDVALMILHTNGGTPSGGSLYGLYNSRANGFDGVSHFQVMWDGTVEQYVSVDQQAYAQFAGNAYGVSVETQDDGDPTKKWTRAQLDSIVRIGNWLGCPPKVAEDGPHGGVGWHQEYADWNRSAHDCPGPVRRKQVTSHVIPNIGN